MSEYLQSTAHYRRVMLWLGAPFRALKLGSSVLSKLNVLDPRASNSKNLINAFTDVIDLTFRK